MNEERVTINILKWLEYNGWIIVAYDYPQSGTGTIIHPSCTINKSSKNEGGIIPDIIAVKDETAVFFENKDRFFLTDFKKLSKVKLTGNYIEGINQLLKEFNTIYLYFGIGLPHNKKDIVKSLNHVDKIDFLISTNKEGEVFIDYDKFNIFYT